MFFIIINVYFVSIGILKAQEGSEGLGWITMTKMGPNDTSFELWVCFSSFQVFCVFSYY